MHDRLPVILLLICALAGCTVNTHEPEQLDSLVFSAVASHSTKAIISTTNYPLDVAFVVEAVHYPGGTGEGKPFMTAEQVEYDSHEGLWKTKEIYFWPRNGKIVFYAGSPASAVSISAERGVEADWSIPDENHASTDLCFAEVEEPCKGHSAVVPIVFTHALSQVCFKARTLRHYSNSQTADNLIQSNIITVVLDSVKIGGIASEGHFSQIPLSWKPDAGSATEYVVYNNKEGKILQCDRYDNPVLTHLNTMLLLPQTISGAAYIEEWHHCRVRTSITDSDTGEIVSDETYTVPKSSVTALAGQSKLWAPGYKFTYRIAVGLEDTVISTAVTDWTETNEIIPGDE